MLLDGFWDVMEIGGSNVLYVELFPATESCLNHLSIWLPHEGGFVAAIVFLAVSLSLLVLRHVAMERPFYHNFYEILCENYFKLKGTLILETTYGAL